VQPHSGSQANAAAYFALVQPGDRYRHEPGSRRPPDARLKNSGVFRAAQYGIRPDTGEIDYEQVQRLARSTGRR
jgi:glycine hydroxymethyltransferase